MKLTWLGTAGFEIITNDAAFYTDPYLTRNPNARPVQPKTVSDIIPDSPIFISHGHFDHLMDIPDIANASAAPVYCSQTAAQHLLTQKLDNRRIQAVEKDRERFVFDHFTAQALFSRHVRFDFKLVVSTLLKINARFFSILPYFRQFPCGQVLGWRFFLEGRSVLFYGSAGATREELEQTAADPVDILLMPLQGHFDICAIALKFVTILKPAIVIPHHHDNFFPPVSKTVDIRPFVDGVARTRPQTRVIVPEMNRVIRL